LPEEREIDEGAPEIPLASPNLMSNTMYNPFPNTTDLDLHALLLALINQTNNLPKKRNRGIKEPDSFSRGNPDKLRAFIFQCQIYFHAYEGEFLSSTRPTLPSPLTS